MEQYKHVNKISPEKFNSTDGNDLEASCSVMGPHVTSKHDLLEVPAHTLIKYICPGPLALTDLKARAAPLSETSSALYSSKGKPRFPEFAQTTCYRLMSVC